MTFLTMVTRWSRSTSNFYVLIGQKLTGEFMKKKKFLQHLETLLLIAETDRVLCSVVNWWSVPAILLFAKTQITKMKKA